MPLRLIAGAADRVAHVEPHSARLHREMPGSELYVLAGAGHMIHYVAQNAIVEAVAALSRPPATTVQRSG
jgi:pimeloyl-ACP methyl ester carboxylesterase